MPHQTRVSPAIIPTQASTLHVEGVAENSLRSWGRRRATDFLRDMYMHDYTLNESSITFSLQHRHYLSLTRITAPRSVCV